MKHYILYKQCFDLKNHNIVTLLQERYKKYYTQRIEGSCYCLMYFNNNLVFARRNDNSCFLELVSVFAPPRSVRSYWSTFPLKNLSKRFYNLYFNHKTILL